MTAFASVYPMSPHRDPPLPTVVAAESCIFCDPAMKLRTTGEEPLPFLAHLSTHSRCSLEYQMWKQVITDEWEGD